MCLLLFAFCSCRMVFLSTDVPRIMNDDTMSLDKSVLRMMPGDVVNVEPSPNPTTGELADSVAVRLWENVVNEVSVSVVVKRRPAGGSGAGSGAGSDAAVVASSPAAAAPPAVPTCSSTAGTTATVTAASTSASTTEGEQPEEVVTIAFDRRGTMGAFKQKVSELIGLSPDQFKVGLLRRPVDRRCTVVATAGVTPRLCTCRCCGSLSDPRSRSWTCR
jgi:hypothetical protein